MDTFTFNTQPDTLLVPGPFRIKFQPQSMTSDYLLALGPQQQTQYPFSTFACLIFEHRNLVMRYAHSEVHTAGYAVKANSTD